MGKVTAIALNTFKEAIRNRILYVILIFALILIAFSGVVSELTIASQMKIIKNLGFMSINLFGVAIAVFVGVSLVYNELEKKTIYTIVSKPIGRWQFLLGKYFGLLLTVLVNVFIMTFFFLVAVHYYSGTEGEHGFAYVLGASFLKAAVTFVNWGAYEATANIMQVTAITCLELSIVTAFAVLFSSFSTPTLSMFFTVLTFVAGRLNNDIVGFADHVWLKAYRAALAAGPGSTLDLPFSYYFATAAANVIPNLGVFSDTVEQAIYESHISLGWWAVAYGFVYTACVLTLSMLIFQRRNFK